jgi:hypothetical protein
MSANFAELRQFVLAQFAAESYLDGISWTSSDDVARRLRLGSNNYIFVGDSEATSNVEDLDGKTRMTDTQIADFTGRYDVVHHQANTISGFSATLLFDRDSGG